MTPRKPVDNLLWKTKLQIQISLWDSICLSDEITGKKNNARCALVSFVSPFQRSTLFSNFPMKSNSIKLNDRMDYRLFIIFEISIHIDRAKCQWHLFLEIPRKLDTDHSSVCYFFTGKRAEKGNVEHCVSQQSGHVWTRFEWCTNRFREIGFDRV